MPACPDCGGELVVSTAHDESRGTHRVFECNACGEYFEIDEVEKE